MSECGGEGGGVTEVSVSEKADYEMAMTCGGAANNKIDLARRREMSRKKRNRRRGVKDGDHEVTDGVGCSVMTRPT
jgi:hypothetical protein